MTNMADGSVAGDPRLGRIPLFDERSRSYAAEKLMTVVQQTTPRSYTWRVPTVLDQGNLGACVAFSWSQELLAKPVLVPGVTNSSAKRLYCDVQAADPWDGASAYCNLPGPHYEGTAVLTAAQVLKSRGYYTGYSWAFSLDEMVSVVGHLGPVVIGVNWYEGMMDTDRRAYVHPTGGVVGGHAILVNRVNVTEKFFGLKNSWGAYWGAKDAWGVGGSCRVSFTDMARLLSEDGECCVPAGRKIPNP